MKPARGTCAAKRPAGAGKRRGRGGRLPLAVPILLCALALFGAWRLAGAIKRDADAAREYEAAYAVAGEAGAPLPAMTLEPLSTRAAGQAALSEEGQEAGPAEPFAAEPTGYAAAVPTPTPTAAPTPEPTATPVPFAYLPVVHRANTEAKKIAVTVDDCYQLENLKAIIQAAEGSGAKLTLFPVGENVARKGTGEALKRAALDLHFEIENHTWSHARIFRLSQEEMAAEIWKQSAAVNRALGVNYREHFLRLMGGDGETDQRIHSYLSQLGYLAIANWSVSGSDTDLAHIESRLAPGQVYLFHCTDPDTAKLLEFIPYAVAEGYRLVTLNELFGLPENETGPLTEDGMPEPRPFVYDYRTLKEGEYTWVALLIQEALRGQGYLEMEGPSTGYYGPQTAEAVSAWQRDHGLEATGEADEATQRSILGGEVVPQ